MPNYVLFTPGLVAGHGPANAQPVIATPRIRISLPTVNGGAGVVANDTLDFLPVQSRSLVTHMSTIIVTAAGGTCTAQVGDTSAATTFFGQTGTGEANTAVDLNAAAGTRRVTVINIDAAAAAETQPQLGSAGAWYWSGGTLRATILNTNAVAVFDIQPRIERWSA